MKEWKKSAAQIDLLNDPRDAALAEYLATESEEEARQLVGRTPLLQEEAARARLAELAAQAQTKGQDDIARQLDAQRRQLLRWLVAERHPVVELAQRVARTELSLLESITVLRVH